MSDTPLVLVSNRGPVTYQDDGSVKRGTGGLVTALTGRSEERRVGKECRSLCDWSSDVCSSDLLRYAFGAGLQPRPGDLPGRRVGQARDGRARDRTDGEIGRASCRERV